MELNREKDFLAALHHRLLDIFSFLSYVIPTVQGSSHLSASLAAWPELLVALLSWGTSASLGYCHFCQSKMEVSNFQARIYFMPD